MISTLGHLSIVTALVVALGGAAVSAAGGRTDNATLTVWGRRAAFAILGLVAMATALMIYALVTHDFSVSYVSRVGSRQTPLFYTIITLWVALEGSILFWALLLSVYTVLFLVLYRRRFQHLHAYLTAVLLGISAFFLFIIGWAGDPFGLVSPAAPAPGCPADGCGPNPLLQNHPLMGLHPPLLYLGYVGLSVPFALAVATLLRGAPDADELRLIRRWALVPWIFLSLGITAGMWWSYAVLGWGGYWSWDPVENASLMPWLITTAFLHSLQVQERRQMLKLWTMALIIAAFLFSLLGTFLTRSGVLSSVHSFTQSAVGPLFLSFFGAVMVGSLLLLFVRSRALAAPGALEATVCRETAFLLNNVLLVTITFTVLLGTLFPLLAEALQGTQLSVGAPYFNHIAVPIGFALLFLMGLGPSLPWGAARLDELQYRLLPPVAAGTASILVLLLLGLRGVGALATFGTAAFVLTVTVQRVLADMRARRRGAQEGWLPAGRKLVAANPRRYGGYLAHVGILLAIIGIAASQTYSLRTSATLHRGQSIRLDGYTLTYQSLFGRNDGYRMVLGANLLARRGNQQLGVLHPSNNYYPSQLVITPAVQEQPWDMLTGLFTGVNPLPQLGQLLQGRNPFEDLYVVVEDIGANVRHPQRSSVTLLVLVNPLVGLIWLGGFVTGLGGMLALLPARRRRRVMVTAAEPVRVGSPEEVTV